MVFTCAELTQQASYGGGYTIIDVKTAFASTLSCSRELDELVSNSLAVKLEEIPLVLRRILFAYLEVVCFSPGSGYVNVAIRAGNHKRPLRFSRLAENRLAVAILERQPNLTKCVKASVTFKVGPYKIG